LQHPGDPAEPAATAPTASRPGPSALPASVSLRPWLGAAALWLLLVALLATIIHLQRLGNWRHEAQAAGAMRLSSLRDNLEGHFRNLGSLGRVVAQEPLILDSLRANAVPDATQVGEDDRIPLRELLRSRVDVRNVSRRLDRLARDFRLRQIYLQDVHGTVVADSTWEDPLTTLGANFRVRDAFSQALQTGESFQFVMGRVSKKPGFTISVRVDDADRPMGVLVLKLDLHAMPELFEDPLGRALMVVDANGVIVAGNRPDWHLRQVPGGIDLSSQLKDAAGLYRGIPGQVDWSPDNISVDGAALPGWRINGQAHLAQSAAVPGVPVAVWVLSPLGAERALALNTMGWASLAALVGWSGLWVAWKRRERLRQLAALRKDTLDMTRALPLAVFRFRRQLNGEGHFAFLSPQAPAMLGRNDADLRDHPVWPDTPQGMSSDTPPLQPTLWTAQVSGDTRSLIVHSAASLEADGTQVFDGYWQDVTAHRRAESRFEAAFQHAPVAQLFCHPKQGVLRCNAAALRLFGATSLSQIQRWQPPQWPQAEEGGDTDGTSPRAEQPLQLALRLQRTDGSSFDAAVLLIRLGGEDPDLTFAIIEDMTARKQTEAALREARDAARETTQAKSAFLANMSHEIRTPMNAIIGMTHLALQDGTPERQRNYVAKAHQAANSLLQIINDILDMSKIEAGHLELECIDFPLQDVLDQVANVLGLPIEQKGLELVFDLPADLPARLQGDPTRLRQVLVNLGSNAVKFTPGGSVTIGMRVLKREGHDITLHGWVRDTGIGLSSDQAQRLFQPFTQLDASTTREFGGTGLGLSISRQLVERMHGRMWVDSAAQAGATFHFEVKLGLPEQSAPMAAPRQAWEGRRVLLVDDNPDARETLAQMATQFGLQVDTAASGHEALQALTQAKVPFDWVLLDWKMPDMDGITCAQHIQAHQQARFPGHEACILLVTAFNREDALRAAANTPLADVLTKPVTPSTLFDSLGKALSRQSVLRPMPAPSALNTLKLGGRLQGLRILLVEDQPLNQELAMDLLQRAGATVVLANDGIQALDALDAADSSQAFDCVLMDCQMPRLDGYATTQRIRTNPRWQRLPVIAMTASALVSDRERALEAGMNDHISKPLDVEQMLQVIGRWASLVRPGLAATST
jgi:two-component system sensor histidine kinase/response regulator